MSRLNLKKRLLPARKVWKTITSKLQTKLSKLHGSKPNKTSKNKLKNTRTPLFRPPLSLYFRFKRKRRHLIIKPSLTLHPHYYRRYLLQKRSSPVYIHGLFKQPKSEVGTNSVVDKQITMEGTRDINGNGEICKRDDMQESMGLYTPQMNGIDDRAEDFIARFRAEMELQEMMARNL